MMILLQQKKNILMQFISNPLINTQKHPFHIVNSSWWPFQVASSLGFWLVMFVQYLHGMPVSRCLFMLGLCCLSILVLCGTFIAWCMDIYTESVLEGYHTKIVCKNLQFGFLLFIISEVMLFFSFFWAFFHSAINPSIMIGGIWPPYGVKAFYSWGMPFTNTIILLVSGITITWAHSAMSALQKLPIFSFLVDSPWNILRFKEISNMWSHWVCQGLMITICLGCLFSICQGYEYWTAEFDISDGIYGSTFFMWTGLHGVHVLIGTMGLIFHSIRFYMNHLNANSWSFEFTVWYWHFVDIIWLGVFTFVYVWGNSSDWNFLAQYFLYNEI